MKLRRLLAQRAGIFSELVDDHGTVFAALEHAYIDSSGNAVVFRPKLIPGTYTCRRGTHQLHSGPIDTFEILGVPGHSGILFHRGNFHEDSDGCVLLGLKAYPDNPKPGIVDSAVAFTKFMDGLVGVDEFTLEVFL